MKKLSILLVICVVISSLVFSANATTLDRKSQEQTARVESLNSDNQSQSVQKELAAAFEQAHLEDVQAAQAYAYLDLESASEEMKEKILEARNTIIFSQGWTTEGVFAYVEHSDGTIEVLPQFSDLFPGWDIPTEEPRTVEEISEYLEPQSDVT